MCIFPFNSKPSASISYFPFTAFTQIGTNLQIDGCMIWMEGVREGNTVCVFFPFLISSIQLCVRERGMTGMGEVGTLLTVFVGALPPAY